MSTTRPYSPGDRGPEPSGASGASAGRQVRRLSFDGASGVVPLARDFARQALYAWGWLPAAGADRRAAAEDVLLVVSELVTNACLHAEGPDGLQLSCDNKVIRVEVSDRGTGQPAPRTPTARAAPAATACSSCSASASTGGSSAPRRSRAKRYGRNWAPRPDPTGTAGRGRPSHRRVDTARFRRPTDLTTRSPAWTDQGATGRADTSRSPARAAASA